jgi:hypothetical protein
MPQRRTNEKLPTSSANAAQRVFIGVFPGGISYADRLRERDGDYARLAFLPYDTLKLALEKDCPYHLRPFIEASARAIQQRRGESFQLSQCNQTVILGTLSSRA